MSLECFYQQLLLLLLLKSDNVWPSYSCDKGNCCLAHNVVSLFFVLYSIFENGPIPYPKREFLTDDENDDKIDTATSKVTAAQLLLVLVTNLFLTFLCNNQRKSRLNIRCLCLDGPEAGQVFEWWLWSLQTRQLLHYWTQPSYTHSRRSWRLLCFINTY